MAETNYGGSSNGGSSGGDDWPNRGRSNLSKDSPLKDPSQSKKDPRKKQQEGESDESCDESTAVDSTAALTTPMTVGSLASTAAHHPVEIERRDRLQQQLIVLSVTTMATLAVFITTIVPMTILLAFGLFATSAGALTYTSYQRLLLYYREVLAGDGFAQFLPANWVRALTQESVHEVLRDDSFFREWGFLAVYLIPGLSEQQLNAYIHRLAPDRHEFLNRPGMGHVFGNRFMRALLGERRWRQGVIDGPLVEPLNEDEAEEVAEVVTTTRSRGLETISDHDSNQSGSPLGLTVPRDAPVNNEEEEHLSRDEQRRRELAVEEGVVTEAIWDGVWNFVNAGVVAISRAVYEEMVLPAGGVAATVGVFGSAGITFVSIGAGIWNHHRPISAGGLRHQREIGGFLMTTTIIGGISTGAMYLARRSMRNARQSAKPPGPPKSQPKEK